MTTYLLTSEQHKVLSAKAQDAIKASRRNTYPWIMGVVLSLILGVLLGFTATKPWVGLNFVPMFVWSAFMLVSRFRRYKAIKKELSALF